MSATKGKRDEIVAAGVSLGCFIASAAHIVSQAQLAGNHPAIAGVHALGIDGLIYIGIRAMQRGNKLAGGAALAYGATISLIFNCASYEVFPLPRIVIAFTMPVAMVLGVLVVHGRDKDKDRGQDTGHVQGTRTRDRTKDKATRTHVLLDVQRESVPVSSDVHPVVHADVHPMSTPDTITGQVVPPVSTPAIERGPAPARWDVARATELITTTAMSNADIGADVGTSSKTIQRLRSKIKTP